MSDIGPARDMPIAPGMMYVFDLAYNDFRCWHQLDQQGCRFVTRLKSHTRLREGRERPVAPNGAVLADGTGFLPLRLSRSGANPYADPVRQITVRIATGKLIRLLTNDLDAPAEELAELYKQRWQIELFFKWIKQNLRITRFLGTSENVVRIQIFVALIAYLLIRAVHGAQTSVGPILTFARLLRLNIMHKRPLNAFKTPRPDTTHDTRQMQLAL